MSSRRLRFWSLFLGAAAGLAILPEFWDQDSAPVQPTQRRTPPDTLPPSPANSNATATPPSAAMPLATLRSDAPEPDAQPVADAVAPPLVPDTDLFAAKTWVVPPPPPPPPPPPGPPPPPAPPAAPPVPFRYFGRLDDAQTSKAFLQKGEQAYTVSPGEVIENTYRVDTIQPGVVTLTYLPLAIQQTLTAGGTQ